jgi:excisionase family DNA binding protein
MKRKTIEELKNELLSPQDVCDILKIKMQTLYNWIYEERIPSIKMGSRLRFRRGDIETFLNRLTRQ